MRVVLRQLLMLVASVAAWAAAAMAQAAPALLTVGPGWAWVRESFPPSGEKALTRLVWTNPPAQCDLDTLQVWNVRRPWPMQDWHWLGEEPAAPAPDEPIRWQPPHRTPPPPSRPHVEIRLAEPMSDLLGHSLTYRLPGFNWQAFYRVIVRGIGPESIESVQVDLEAFLHIQNNTAATFPDARVAIVGPDESLLPATKPFGLLALDYDNPLTDLWRNPPAPEPLVPAAYPLDVTASIPAHGRAEVRFARITRKPAQITHVCHSSVIHAPTPQGGRPLQRVLQIPNTPAMGLGYALPPGRADLFLGAARGAPFQSGRVRHTPFPGTLELDLGTVETVRAMRQMGVEEPLPEGAKQVDYTITLTNGLTSPIRVQVIEQPLTPAQWNLVRSSVPCTISSRELTFNLTLPPHSARTITYRLRLSARPQS